LSKKLAAELALALAGINHCQYCALSHTVLSKFAGLNDAQIVNALEGKVDTGKPAWAATIAETPFRGVRFGAKRSLIAALRSLDQLRGTAPAPPPWAAQWSETMIRHLPIRTPLL
jgi:AhpD family alkylhydroperoxidase